MNKLVLGQPQVPKYPSREGTSTCDLLFFETVLWLMQTEIV